MNSNGIKKYELDKRSPKGLEYFKYKGSIGLEASLWYLS